VVIAAQRRRRPVQDLIERTPADGMIGGIGTVNGDLFEGHAAQVVAVSYDYTVLAGTQGLQNHRKKDRLFELAETMRLPVVFFTEGGGGRPGDTDGSGVSGLDCWAFNYFGQLSGLVPLVGINAGFCFAGNAAILGCCDVVIATADSNIGMGGPAMIEGGGLGVFEPTSIGPMTVQQPNGVVDIAVADEAEAVEVAKRYLAYFQGAVDQWACADQRELRGVIPEDRKRGYDVRTVIDILFDTDSVLELRRDFGLGMVTALARVEGRPVGVIANNPSHLAGAIDSDGADKAARFMQLCDAFDVPLITLVDTPGMMVGPAVEETALVRHCSRLFVTGANITIPLVSVVLRKSYGLGAQAMMGGSTKAPAACVAWPTGEFGGMGLEGFVRLGYRRELDAIADPDERERSFQARVAEMYERGKALNAASHFEIDDVIDPAETRRWISAILNSAPPPAARAGKKRPNIDTW
jgi:acetyl-CoA carboxylase carboxyltransferase component